MEGKHPTHPATVHFPIAFTCLTGGLDAVYAAATHSSTAKYVASAFRTLDIQLDPSTFPVLSYYSTILTLVVSLPTISTGVWELMPLLKRDGISSWKARTAILHAAINDITVLGAAYNWWTRRNVPGFVPSETNLLISTLLSVPSTLFAAYLGGHLVYQYGMGVGRGRSSAKKSQ